MTCDFENFQELIVTSAMFPSGGGAAYATGTIAAPGTFGAGTIVGLHKQRASRFAVKLTSAISAGPAGTGTACGAAGAAISCHARSSRAGSGSATRFDRGLGSGVTRGSSTGCFPPRMGA